MIYFYYGDDTFNSRETVKKLRQKFIETYDTSGHNTHVLDAGDFTLERFFTLVKASGFLASKKFIVLRNSFSIKKFGDAQDDIIGFLKTQKNSKDENYLVFWQEGTPKRNLKLFKYLAERCTPLNCCKEFPKMDRAGLTSWVQREARHYGKTMTADAADLLVSLTENDTWLLHNHIAKLCHSTTEQHITADVVERAIERSQGENIFTLVDAIGEKRTAQALSLLEEYLRGTEDLAYLIAMLIRQYRLILLAHEASAETSNSYAAAQRIGVHPFVAKKMLQQSARYTSAELKRIYGNLIGLDRLLKSDPEKLGAAVTLFVATL